MQRVGSSSSARRGKRVELLKNYVFKHFPSTKMLEYALVGIAVCFVDLLKNSGAFTAEEASEYAKIGTLNGLFVLGRSIGFCGHYLDQKRLKQPLYRHPADDIHIEPFNPRILATERK
ncbi:ATP citrate lyase subunit 1 [Rhodotorula kratochvilovae]